MGKILRIVKVLWAKANDTYLGIETSYSFADHSQPAKGAKHNDCRGYQAVDYWHIRRVIRLLAPTRGEVFYDIGCGKGRVLCCVARHHLKRIVGIDLNARVCEIARSNTALLHGLKTPIEVRCEDVAVADVSDGTIYFMFNPFGGETMCDFLNNVASSLVAKPRHVKFVYCNPVHSSILDSSGWLVRFHELRNMSGGKIVFWKNNLR